MAEAISVFSRCYYGSLQEHSGYSRPVWSMSVRRSFLYSWLVFLFDFFNMHLLNRHLAISWMLFAAIGVIAAITAYYFFLIFTFDDPPKTLLPDSAILQPILESPEGKAFTARYPDYVSIVYQDFYMTQCCSVDLVHILNETGLEETGIILYANVSVSPDLKRITAAGMRLACLIPEGDLTVGWTIKGDIIENLQAEKQHCWEVGPPPLPTDQELIEIASNTDVGKAYLARYPENDVIIERGNIDEGTKVRLMPKKSEPIEYVISVAGYDRVIAETYIVCSDGDYRYPDSSGFWSSFEQNNDCLQSVHDRLLVANQTEQAKAFQEKYPAVGLHKTDYSSRFTITGTDSTIRYLYVKGDVGFPEARLFVNFRPGTTDIINFDVQCGPEGKRLSAPLEIRDFGLGVDVAEFLEDSRCPSS